MEKGKNGKSLTEMATEQIIRHILEHDMKPGDRLPNEYELAQQLGVGRSTLREAIRRLVSRNVLEVRQGAGTFVSRKRGVPEDPLGLTFMGRDPRLALDLIDIRLMLEPNIAAQAARRAAPEQLRRLRACCAAAETLLAAGEDHSAADVEFHGQIAACSGNSVLQNLVPVIASSIHVSIRTTDNSFRQETIGHHRAIVDAIAGGDPDGARYAMITHLNIARQYFVDALAPQKSSDD